MNKNHQIAIKKIEALKDRVNSIVRGKEGVVELSVATLLARGHLLIEDVPGVGKTTLAFSLARAIDCGFHRIQFTSDLMPSDIIGVTVYNTSTNEFDFRRGPLFTNIVLADEINRTTPKTQSALLEAMSERRVSVERQTHVLPEPFMVIATQNPMEYRGTFPLPESQLDRFALHISIGYPEADDEMKALMEPNKFEAIEAMAPVVSSEDIIRIQSMIDQVHVDSSVMDYLMRIISITRTHPGIRLGASTRGGQFFLKIARALAFCESRDFVLPEDVKRAAPNVLGHRIMLKRQSDIGEADEIIRDIVGTIPVPV